MQILGTVPEVIQELGGVCKTAVALNQKVTTVSMWQARKRIPPQHFLNISKALELTGKTASPEVFGMKAVAK